MWAVARVNNCLLICVLCNVTVWAVAKVHKGTLICVLCNVTAVGGGMRT